MSNMFVDVVTNLLPVSFFIYSVVITFKLLRKTEISKKFISVRYINDNKLYKFNSIDEITNCKNVTYINCSNNNLTTLPENMDFPLLKLFICTSNNLVVLPKNMNFPLLYTFVCACNNLTELPKNINFPLLRRLDCSFNQLDALPENMDKLFPLLETLWCSNNNLTSLPKNMNFPQLQTLWCNSNDLTSLPKNMNFPQLQTFWCNSNNITFLPENMTLPQLRTFICHNNDLTMLPENMNFPLLTEFYCEYNKLTTLPVCIMNWRNLSHISYRDNPIELSPQLARFIQRIRDKRVNTHNLNVYGDGQNIHNTSIQSSVRDTINRITCRQDMDKFDANTLNDMILHDDILTKHVKSLLIKYCQNTTVHSSLLLTFAEVLWYVLNTISTDFKADIGIQNEIKQVLNQEMLDAENKCFTGRLNRVVNCLNGFSPLVDIRISDGEQIGNIIVMLREKAIGALGNYSVERHKQLVEHELTDRGYDSETVAQWLEYIE